MPPQTDQQNPAPVTGPQVAQPQATPQVQPQQGMQPLQPIPALQPQPPAKAGRQANSTTPPPPQSNPNSTQNALLISEIRDNLVIMNDGTMRAVVACRSINFDLMSEREREAVEYSYQQFLNSLYFPIQIVIRSQKVDLTPYLDRLDKVRRGQDNMLLGVLMEDYIEFISALAQETNIMDKSSYIIVPYYPSGDMTSAVNSSKNFLTNLFAPQKQQYIRIDENTYSKARDEIKNRVSSVVNGMAQIGVRAVQLNTKDLGELYYNFYNPDTAVREPLGNFEELSAPIVKKGQGAAPQPHLDREIM